MGALEYLSLFGAVLTGGLIALNLSKQSDNFLKLILSFSGAYLLGITFLHLLPEAFHSGNPHVGYFVLGGFLLQLVLEIFSKGVEHGHIHPHNSLSSSFVWSLMIGLSIHAFVEGLPLGVDSHFHGHEGHNHSNNSLLIGIILHKLPAAFALAMLLKLSNFKKENIVALLVIFGLMSPLGAWVGGSLDLNHDQFQNLLGVVVGTFMHIATTILFETDEKAHHHLSIRKLLVIIAGLGLAIISVGGH